MEHREQPDEEQLIAEALGDNPNASQLRLMRAALEERRSRFREDLKRATSESDRAAFSGKIKTLDKQIEALLQEEGITEFVETSVRVTLSKATPEDEE
jgi:hypothetical protein